MTIENDGTTRPMPAAGRRDHAALGTRGRPICCRGRSEIVGATTTDVDEVQATMDGKDVSPPRTARAAADAATAPTTMAVAINRRALLIGGGVVAAGAVGAVLLSGAGGGGRVATRPPTPTPTRRRRRRRPGRRRTCASSTGPSTSTPPTDADKGTVDRFQDETGISVDYSETFNDNNEVYAKEFAAYLDAGNPTPWDIAVPTYWMAARLKSQGWLAPLPFNLIPNYVNLDPQLPRPRLGPGRQVPPAVAGRHHRHRLQLHGHRPRADQDQRPVRPRVQRQDRLLHRDARLGRPGDARPGQRPGRRPPRRR